RAPRRFYVGQVVNLRPIAGALWARPGERSSPARETIRPPAARNIPRGWVAALPLCGAPFKARLKRLKTQARIWAELSLASVGRRPVATGCQPAADPTWVPRQPASGRRHKGPPWPDRRAPVGSAAACRGAPPKRAARIRA